MLPNSDFNLSNSPSSIEAQELSHTTDSSSDEQSLSNSAHKLLPPQDTPTSQLNAPLASKVDTPSTNVFLLLSSGVLILGMLGDNRWLVGSGMAVTFVTAIRVLWPYLLRALVFVVNQEVSKELLAVSGLFLVLLGYLHLTGSLQAFIGIYQSANWDAIGAIGEGVVGAFGQILIAMIALWVAWRQYTIEKDLTIQQNRITQQQTIDSYFQGISDLFIDEEGLLEDWPQERAIAEGRTAAILSSVDNYGKAKILRFLSHSRLLSPIQRDCYLGRAILDGVGGYLEDREQGVRVISLKMMLASADLSYTDLRGTDLSDASFFTGNLRATDLTRTNLSRAILSQANLREAKIEGARFFYGNAEDASPRSRHTRPNFQTGAQTGAVIEDVDFTDVQGLSATQRYYCCAWGGAKTRSTIPGGCENIPNKLVQQQG